jgi:hypothetical protein
VPENLRPPKTSVPGEGFTAPEAAPSPKKARRTRRRWWLLLFLVAGASLLLSDGPWHAALRWFLTLRAARQGWTLSVGGIEGGLFDATELYNVRCVQRSTEGGALQLPPGNTDFQIERAELVLAWRWPWQQRSGTAWVRTLSIEGLRGTCDFTRIPVVEPSPPVLGLVTKNGWRQAASATARRTLESCALSLTRRIAQLDHWLVPAGVDFRGDDFTLERGRYHLRAAGWRIAAAQDQVDHFAARWVEASGPKSDTTLQGIAGWTYLKGSSLSLGDVDLGGGVHLAHATLNGEHLGHRRLDWDGELRALGGSARGQGAVNFSRPRLALEIAGSLEKMGVGPLAGLLGVSGETGGEVQQANFTFRGDPENWADAEMWLAAEATDFQWGQRRWESLELRGVVIHRRVQVHRLELRQSRNQLSFTGECALPAANETAATLPALSGTRWWQSGFSCNIDARVDDLHALGQLAGGDLPELRGRMSVNGRLSSHPGASGIDGYLNVEGSSLSIRGAPLDSLRATLLFQGDELDIADLQATRGADYFNGKGTLQIIGPARYKAELHAAVKDLAIYAPAYADLAFSPQPVSGSLTLDWSGDGMPGANSGAFQGAVQNFFTKSGPAAFGRPIDVAGDGTYSPESLSFRYLLLKEGVGNKRHDALKLEGSLPWTRDQRAFRAGRLLDPDRPMSVRIVCAEAPLDLFAGFAPGLVARADGHISGWCNADGTLRAPKLEADLLVSNASFRPAGSAMTWEKVSARVRAQSSVLQIDEAKGQSGTQTIQLAGGVDLTDTARIGLDLWVHGDDTAGVRDDALSAGLNYTLTLRGVAGGEVTVAGEVGLLAGEYRAPLKLGADDSSIWLRLGERLPFAARDEQMDLHLTATPALRIPGGSPEAEINPDLQLTGTMRAPRLTGELTVHQAPLEAPGGWHGTGDGAWYFTGGDAGSPVVSAFGHADGGGQVFFYGPASAGQMIALSEPESPASFDLAPNGPAVEWAEPLALAAFADVGL